jgi:hypothetical protein
MRTHSFTLLLAGPDVTEESVVDALFEAGCGDALFGRRDSVQYADFDRKSESLAAAVSLAIEEVESVPGMRVLRVEPDELVTATVIAERVGRTREGVRLLIEGKRGPGGFPAPLAWVDAKTRLWQWSDVARWFGERLGRETPLAEGAEFLAAVNAALELRNRIPRLSGADELSAVARLVDRDALPRVIARAHVA